MLLPTESLDHVYTACYCEENVYKLCEQLVHQSAELYAVFVSNSHKQVPFWHQKAGRVPSGFALWDYHVFAVQRLKEGRTVVWDLDTTFPIPCDLAVYAQLVLQTHLELQPYFQRLYRVVPAHDYLHAFASDRSHMRLKDGSYQAAVPSYPCIVASDGNQMRLHQYIDMTAPPELAADHHSKASVSSPASPQDLGVVLTEAAFLAKFVLLPAVNTLSSETDKTALSTAS